MLEELARRGCRVFEEPGRHVVRAERARGGDGLPWVNVQRFADLCIAHGLAQLAEAVAGEGPAFFDRSLVDAVSALEHLNLPVPDQARRALERRPYDTRVFMAPPWPEIFEADLDRRHDFAEARAEFDRLMIDYSRFGFETILIPKLAVAERVDFVLRHARA